ncbi:MAG: glycoside hydrolase family 31 protein [Candidatus Sulfopaludibacter sp.]|nr:glycoside hydrolase family 31 protein [Candidatus Sulfopaludibacter sp.]
MPFQALAAVATVLSFAPQGNQVDFKLDHGAAEIVWNSPATFRFRRSLEDALPVVQMGPHDKVSLKVDETPGAVRIRSDVLEVTVQKHGLLVRVRSADGQQVMADLSEPRPEGDAIVWEREMPAGARFYGLGPRVDPSFDLRGRKAETDVPFLLSTTGYGEFHAGAGPFRFDFTGAGRYRVAAPRVDYSIYYGPRPKEIFKERHAANAGNTVWQVPAEKPVTWTTLRDSLLRMVQAAMSGMLYPSFDLSTYFGADAPLLQRARQVGSLPAKVTRGAVPLSNFRGQLDTFYGPYVPEVEYNGYPVWHPLPFQFPDDPECASHVDEFMLGDEMLIAPIYDGTGKRSLYLPQGVWTNLETNEAMTGRRTIQVSTSALPVFARNGTIVPLDSAGGVALHYFPRLGAEFFILEDDISDYSAVHAAPSLDAMRLEIESKKERDYQWVVHHIDKPASVGFEDLKYPVATAPNQMTDRTWFYDPVQKNLQVRVHARAKEDCIVVIEF